MKLVKAVTAAALTAALLVVPAGALAKPLDRDHDRMPDKWEVRHHLNPRANDARKDPDGDHLSNLSEFRHGTNPQKADTDGDGVSDSNELADHTNPDKQDSNNDGTDDGDEIAGTIVSFDAGVLTIQLPGDGAGTVSGTIDDTARIECDDSEDAPAPTTAAMSRDGSDDNSGPGSADSGSDDGANHDAGDDDQNPACTSADLKPGARVHEAKTIKAADGSTVFTKIELVPAA